LKQESFGEIKAKMPDSISLKIYYMGLHLQQKEQKVGKKRIILSYNIKLHRNAKYVCRKKLIFLPLTSIIFLSEHY